MNVPLNWLAEYVKLPTNIKDLTDKLTSVGHMLDKTTQINGQTVIDLELRGNRADMFGLIGIAREVATITRKKLTLPPTIILPKIDKKSPLINVLSNATDLVTRYTAIKLQVKVGPSPKWLIDSLAAYGTSSVNNIVDVTNYVMLETGQPLHAFDYHKISGGRLLLRKAKANEKFSTITQGQVLSLSPDDLVICDSQKPVALTMIGGSDSKVSSTTIEIVLEAAVYNQANCRRTARRLKVFTDSGLRHEKHLDPNSVSFALERAIYLLSQIASAKITSQTSSYYPNPVKNKSIDFNPREVDRLVGMSIPKRRIALILKSLQFQVEGNRVIIPTFRTDVEQSADIVEEIIRIHGYDRIPEVPISDPLPIPQTYPSYSITEKLRDIFCSLGLDEVISLSMAHDGEVKLINPPDPNLSYLRHQIAPNLVAYARRLLNLRQKKVAIFEIGKVFYKHAGKTLENLHLGIAMSENQTTVANLTGSLQSAAALLGINKLPVQIGNSNGVYWAEIEVDKLLSQLPAFSNPYFVLSVFPPIIEDINVRLTSGYSNLVSQIKKISPLIKQIDLIDNYDSKLTLRLTYHSDSKQLSAKDIVPIREKFKALGWD